MRFAYLKQNNVVQELKRVNQSSSGLPEGGPDAYVAHLINVIQGHSGLLLSVRSNSPQGEVLKIDNVEAKSFYWFSRVFKNHEKLANSPLLTFWPRFTAAIKIFINLLKFKPSMILCWAVSFPLWSAYLVAKLHSAKFIYCRHTSFDPPDKNWFRKIFDAIDIWIMNQAGNVIVHGPYLKQQALERGVKPSLLVEFNWSFTDMPEIQTGQQLPSIKNRAHQVLFIGRLEASKGVYELLDACESRLRGDAEIKLIYAGGGSALNALSKLIKDRELSNKVELLGMVPHSNLAELIQSSTVVVTPTRSNFPEGRCMATMEGLVMGVPVIAPDFGPFPYLVDHGVNGLLYEPDSVEDLQECIFNLIDDHIYHKKLCEGARCTSKSLRSQGPNFSEALKSVFTI